MVDIDTVKELIHMQASTRNQEEIDEVTTAAASFLQSDPDGFLTALVDVAGDESLKDSERMAALSHLQNYAGPRYTVFENLEPQTIQTLQESILSLATAEITAALRNLLSEVVCQLYRSCHKHEIEFEDFLSFLYSAATSEMVGPMTMSMQIIIGLCPILQKEMEDEFYSLVQIIQPVLESEQPVAQGAAFRAIKQCLVSLPSTNLGGFETLFADGLPLMVQLLESEHESIAREVTVALQHLLDAHPRLANNQINDIATLFLQVAESVDLNEKTRLSAIDYLVCLTKKLPRAVRKVPEFVKNVLSLLLSGMMMLEDDPGFADRDDPQNDVRCDFQMVCATALDVFAKAIADSEFVQLFIEFLQELVSADDADWRNRAAAMQAIACALEGMCHFMTPELVYAFYEFIEETLSDENVRVRFSALLALVQLATEASELFVEVSMESAVTALANILIENTDSARIISLALNCLSTVLTHAPKSFLRTVHSDIIDIALIHVESDSLASREEALTSLSLVFQSVPEAAEQYFDDLVVFLMDIIRDKHTEKTKALRSAAFTLFSFLGMAQPELFKPYADEFMGYVIQLQKDDHKRREDRDKAVKTGTYKGDADEADDDDAFFDDLLNRIIVRVSTVLKEDFSEYLEVLMPRYIHLISREETIYHVDPEAVPTLSNFLAMPVMDDEGLHYVGIRTGEVNDKIQAIKNVGAILTQCPIAMLDYVSEFLADVIELLTFFDDDVIEDAAKLLNVIIMEFGSLAKDDNDGGYEQFYNDVVSEIGNGYLAAISETHSLDTIASLFSSLVVYLSSLLPESLDSEYVVAVLTSVCETLNKVVEQREAGEEQNEEILFDDELADYAAVKSTCDAVGVLLKLLKDEVAENAFKVLGHIEEILSQHPLAHDSHCLIYLSIDLLEYVHAPQYIEERNEMAVHYSDLAFNHVPDVDADPGIIQTIAYCMSVYLQEVPELLGEQLSTKIVEYAALLEGGQLESQTCLPTRDNIIGMLYRACTLAPEGFFDDETKVHFMTLVVNALPLMSDYVENRILLPLFLSAITSEDELLLGIEGAAEKLVLCFVRAYDTIMSSPEANHRIQKFIVQIQDSGLLESLSELDQAKAALIIEEAADSDE